MDTMIAPDQPSLVSNADASPLSRRGFLRTAAVAGGGLVAATVVACTPASTRSAWSYGPSLAPAASAGAPSAPAPASSAAPSMDHAASGSPSDAAAASGAPGPTASTAPPSAIPAGWAQHDVVAKTKVDRFLAAEYDQLPAPNPILKPKLDGGVKVFELTIDEIEHRIDAQGQPLAALGFSGIWTGPQIRVVEGDRIRAIFTNNLKETTGCTSMGRTCPTTWMASR
jgi:FtsP/CotA-like multicopper oxidase with cupredoxin domain